MRFPSIFKFLITLIISFGLIQASYAAKPATVGQANNHPVIDQVAIDYTGSTYVVQVFGTNFGSTDPAVSLGGADIGLTTATDTYIEFDLLPGQWPAGDYQLTVLTGPGNQADSYDLTLGAVGPQGEKGDKGDQGDQGIQGIQGVQGDKGDKGDKGDQGIQGVAGAVGAQGFPGPVGPKGDKGDTGATGPKGDTGATGPKGDTGATGPAGPEGQPMVYSGSTASDSFLRAQYFDLGNGICDDAEGCHISLYSEYGNTMQTFGPYHFKMSGNKWWFQPLGGGTYSLSTETNGDQLTTVIAGTNSGSSFCYFSDWDTSGHSGNGDQDLRFGIIYRNTTTTNQLCSIKIED